MSDLQHIKTRIAEIQNKLRNDPSFARWAKRRVAQIDANDERLDVIAKSKPTSSPKSRRFRVAQQELEL